jgi:hypothetical protein
MLAKIPDRVVPHAHALAQANIPHEMTEEEQVRTARERFEDAVAQFRAIAAQYNPAGNTLRVYAARYARILKEQAAYQRVAALHDEPTVGCTWADDPPPMTLLPWRIGETFGIWTRVRPLIIGGRPNSKYRVEKHLSNGVYAVHADLEWFHGRGMEPV